MGLNIVVEEAVKHWHVNERGLKVVVEAVVRLEYLRERGLNIVDLRIGSHGRHLGGGKLHQHSFEHSSGGGCKTLACE